MTDKVKGAPLVYILQYYTLYSHTVMATCSNLTVTVPGSQPLIHWLSQQVTFFLMITL